MKLRWWVVGLVAVAAGSIFMIKHMVDNKRMSLSFVDTDDKKSLNMFPHEIIEPEFDGMDFSA